MNTRSRRLLAIGVAVGVIAGLGAPGTIGAGPDTKAPVTVTVTRDGRAVAGAKVVVRALPAQNTWEATPDAAPLDLPIVARGVTDAKGRIHLTPANVGDRANEDGDANFMAVVTDAGVLVTWTFPLKVQVGATAAGKGTNDESKRHRAVDLLIDIGSESGAADMMDPPAKWSGLGKDNLTTSGLLRIEKSAVPDAGVTPQQYCYYYWTDWKYNINVPIGNLWSWSGAKMSQTYDTSVTSTLGTAFQANTGGPLSVSGTVSFAVTSASGGTVNNLVDVRTHNQVNYRRLTDSCFMSGTWYPYNTVNILHPIYGVSPQPNWEAASCGEYRNASMYKTAGTNQTFGAGVNLGPISVSANTAWKTDNKLTWTFGTAWSRLCGSNSTLGWVSSPQAEAHAK